MPANSEFSVDDLIRIAPPPEILSGRVPWDRWGLIENDLGTELPNDYKLIMTCYGNGYFNDLFWLLSPSALTGEHSDHAMYEEFKQVFPEACPFPTYPEHGGLIPLGGSTTGDSIFWLTEGRPDEWPLIFYPHGFYEFEKHSMRLVEFLVRWLSQEEPGRFFGRGECFRTDPIFQN